VRNNFIRNVVYMTPLQDWIMCKANINVPDRKLLEGYQLNKVIETVQYAKKNSRFYKEALKDIHEDEFCSLEDLQRLPFTISNQISNNPFDFLCVPQSQIKRIVTLNSSGTSGKNKRIFFTEEDLEGTIDFFKWGMSCLTDENDRVLVLLPGNAYGSIGDLLKKALSISKIPCFVKGVLVDPEEIEKLIIEEGITCIVGIPMQIMYFSRVKSEVFKSRIKKVLLSTDYVPQALINELTHLYGCKVFTHYGMTETGYGGGVECEALNGYHMREADLYFEIINPDTGKAALEGQTGEVVFTTLTRQAMPIIRYRTGDVAAFSSSTCVCGTFLKTMNRVIGRMDNKVCIKDNKFIYLRDLDEIVLEFKEVIDYKVSKKEADKLTIEVITQCNAGSQSIMDKITIGINEGLYNKLGYKINLEVIESSLKRPEIITSSMVKRKIFDYSMLNKCMLD